MIYAYSLMLFSAYQRFRFIWGITFGNKYYQDFII